MTTRTLASPAYKDPRRFLWIISPLIPVMAIAYLGIARFGGLPSHYWLFPIVIYVFMPIADWAVGEDRSGPPEAELSRLDSDPYYRALIYAFIPGQFAATLFGAWLSATGGLTAWEMLGVALTVGMVNGVAFIPAHELTHKNASADRWLARLTLSPMAYGHFFAEHVRGHHKNVATPNDPTSAKMGESFWSFLLRAIIDGVRSAWRLEAGRLKRKGKSVWSAKNVNLQTWALTLLLYGALIAWLNWIVLPYLLLQAFFSVVLLEVTDYIEHYGLLRRVQDNGAYEPCTPAHAWDSNHVVCTLFLYQLQRHADHHAHPGRRFQSLRSFDTTPQLPASYVTMMLVAYIPPLWFRIMNPRVIRHYGGDLGNANLHPAKRDALMREASSLKVNC